jgi:hypothetical protein
MDTLLARISALIADTSPKAVATTRYIQAILDGKVTIPGGIKSLMAELACDGYVNPEIDDAHFPGADAFVSIQGVVLVEIYMDVWTDPQAIEFLANLKPPMQPVMPDKGIKWAAANPDAQRKNPLVILGQKCRDSGGNVCVLVLHGSYRERYARLTPWCGFSRHSRVLAEPKKLVPGT